MVIERGVRYGRTTDEVRRLGYPEDNRSNVKVDNEIILTGDEIRDMFPNQYVVLKAVEFKNIYALSNFERAIVLYFKCEGHFASNMVRELREKDSEGVYFSATYYDPLLEEEGFVISDKKVLSLKDIVSRVKPIAEKYQVEKIYLFGSYARKEATEDSDLDFLVYGGEKFRRIMIFALAEDLREALSKKVDVFEINEVNTNSSFYNTIMKERMLIA